MTTKTYSPEQLAAIESDATRVLVVAGPGSGKTTVLVQRILREILIAGAQRLVVITFTNAAAKELSERLEAALGHSAKFGYLGTLHGFALRELERHGGLIGYDNAVTVLDAEQSEALLLEVAASVKCKTSKTKLHALRRDWHRRSTDALIQSVDEIAVMTYLRRLRMVSAVDFDSLLVEFNRLQRHDQYPAEWECCFVDEYQDTGELDALIYDAMPTASMFIVGDPDQAIYGFRGGTIANIMDLARHPDWRTYYLEGNYRCGARICAAANRLIQCNTGRLEKLTRNVDAKHAGQVHLLPGIGIDDAEKGRVLQLVEARLDAGEAPEGIAILARGNALVREFSETARLMGLPVREKHDTKTPEDWRLARAALELIHAPGNTLAADWWITLRHGPQVATELRRRAAKEQVALWMLNPDGELFADTPGVGRGLGSRLARLGISIESIELIQAVAADMLDPSPGAISYAITLENGHTREQGHGVTITTIHGAKGREWHTVYIVGCEQELMPGTSKSRNPEEERRIMFVGITRAIESLTITSATKRRQPWGQKRHADATPSQFIAEVRA